MLKSILKRQAVQDRSEHAHVIGRSTIHPFGGPLDAAEDISSADHNGDLDTALLDFLDFLSQDFQDISVDAVASLARQCFSGKFK
jgi:hypothetical protein